MSAFHFLALPKLPGQSAWPPVESGAENCSISSSDILCRMNCLLKDSFNRHNG